MLSAVLFPMGGADGQMPAGVATLNGVEVQYPCMRRAVEALLTQDFESGMNRHLNYLDDMEPALDELLLTANSLIHRIDNPLGR